MVADLRAGATRHALTVLVAAFAVGAFVEDLVSPSVLIHGTRYDRGPETVIAAALTAAVVLIALRRRISLLAPIAALAVLALAALPARAWLLNSPAMFLLVMLLCGMCGFLSRGRWLPIGLAVLWVLATTVQWRQPAHIWRDWFLVGGYMTIAWTIGVLVRRPVAEARSAQERALRLEQEQAAAAELAVQQERRRIARELHDIIAHSVSVMTVQAGGVRRLLRPDQEREREALASIEQTGRDALAEMRRLVGLLKDESDTAYHPQPGLASLDALATKVTEAGLPVHIKVDGESRALSPGVDLTAFRVVQEALTNALKYAGPAEAWVTLGWTSHELTIEIANNGDSTQGHTTGFGLAGMRERLELYGGRLECGPGETGGFVVRAQLPFEVSP